MKIEEINKIAQNVSPVNRSDFRYVLIALDELDAFAETLPFDGELIETPKAEHIATLRGDASADRLQDRLNELITALQEAGIME
jgi:hypothetical protein